MLSLIIETSSELGLIVLSEKDRVIAFKELKGGKELSKSIALETKKLLGDSKPELIAVGQGPGSYTGIRVGAALAKGLKIGFNAKIMGFCSLKAFGPAPVLIDARRGGFYALLEEKSLLLDPQDPQLLSCGCIGSPHPELIQKRLPQTKLEKRFLHPEALAKLVWNQYKNEGLQPLKLNYVSQP